MFSHSSNIRQTNLLIRQREADLGSLFIRTRWHYQSGLTDSEISRDNDSVVKNKQFKKTK
jgi:hypothetical protein